MVREIQDLCCWFFPSSTNQSCPCRGLISYWDAWWNFEGFPRIVINEKALSNVFEFSLLCSNPSKRYTRAWPFKKCKFPPVHSVAPSKSQVGFQEGTGGRDISGDICRQGEHCWWFCWHNLTIDLLMYRENTLPECKIRNFNYIVRDGWLITSSQLPV